MNIFSLVCDWLLCGLWDLPLSNTMLFSYNVAINNRNGAAFFSFEYNAVSHVEKIDDLTLDLTSFA